MKHNDTKHPSDIMINAITQRSAQYFYDYLKKDSEEPRKTERKVDKEYIFNQGNTPPENILDAIKGAFREITGNYTDFYVQYEVKIKVFTPKQEMERRRKVSPRANVLCKELDAVTKQVLKNKRITHIDVNMVPKEIPGAKRQSKIFEKEDYTGIFWWIFKKFRRVKWEGVEFWTYHIPEDKDPEKIFYISLIGKEYRIKDPVKDLKDLVKGEEDHENSTNS